MSIGDGGTYSFYTQAAVLDAVKEQVDPQPDVVDVVVQALRVRDDIRKYFFLKLTNPAWARIFHQRGMFTSCESETLELRPHLMNYLCNVAPAVPEVVYDVARQVVLDNYYDLYHLLGAIRSLGSEQLSEVLLNHLPKWIRNDVALTRSITAEIIDTLVKAGQQCGAVTTLPAFEVLLEPLPPSGDRTAACRGDLYWLSDKRQVIVEHLLQAPVDAATLLESVLVRAMDTEAQSTGDVGRSTWGFWRTAVEDTDQDQSEDIKDVVLILLRDLMEAALRRRGANGYPDMLTRVRSYLGCEQVIFVRLGLHLIRLFCDTFQSEVEQLVLDGPPYENSEIQHEFFLLLRDTCEKWSPTVRHAVVSLIKGGPSPHRLSEMGTLYADRLGLSPEVATDKFRGYWIRDRLWMVQGCLGSEDLSVLEELTNRLGKPEHPEFTSHFSSGWVEGSSPFSVEELLALQPAEALQWVANWSPENEAHHFDGPSKEGLARTLQAAVKANPEGFSRVATIVADLQLEPGYVSHFLEGIRDAVKDGQACIWPPIIELCEHLSSIRPDQMMKVSGWDRYWHNWGSAHKSVVTVLQEAITAKTELDPALGERLLLVLFALADHPDPDDEADRPKPGFFGHDDPSTVALNHVRPKAIEAIIRWCHWWARRESSDADRANLQRTMRSDVRSLLEAKLKHIGETSLAVHSLFGRFFPLLTWLDQDFTWAHVDLIFPVDEEAYFGAAFSSFVRFNAMYVDYYPRLRTKYQAVVEKNVRLPGFSEEVLKNTMGHVLLAYALGLEELSAQDTPEQSLVSLAYKLLPVSVVAGATWFLRGALATKPTSSRTSLLDPEAWSRIRKLMTWRLDGLAREDWPTERDDEVKWLVGWIEAQPAESLATAYPLLAMMVPCVARNRHGWHEFEEYLAHNVGDYPRQAAALYRQLFDYVSEGQYLILRDEARRILETAAAHGGEARADALATIDKLARLGYFNFRDIYDAYSFGTDL